MNSDNNIPQNKQKDVSRNIPTSEQESEISESQITPGQIIVPGESPYVTEHTNNGHNSIKKHRKASYTNKSGRKSLSSNSKISSKKLIFIFVLCILLITGIVVGLLLTQISTKNSSPTITSNSKNSIEAKSIDDFATVCSGNTISNSASISIKPRYIALFDQNGKGSSSFSVVNSFINETSWLPTNSMYSNISLVGCLTHTSEQLTDKTCQVTDDNGVKTPLRLYSVEYMLTLYEAKTGTILGNTAVSSSDESCPTTAYYSQQNTKLYSSPDKTQLSQFISPYINQQ